jgi:DnaK suppressor protein
MKLNPGQIDELKLLIARRCAVLAAELRRDAGRARDESFGALAGSTHDSGDEAVAALIADLGQAELSRDVEELRGLDAARKRLAAGTYGVCVDCDVEIGFERLRAAPGTLRCVACQERREKTFATPGRASL